MYALFIVHSSPLQTFPAYSSLIKPIQHIPAYSSLFQHIPTCSIQFKPLPVFPSLFQPIQSFHISIIPSFHHSIIQSTQYPIIPSFYSFPIPRARLYCWTFLISVQFCRQPTDQPKNHPNIEPFQIFQLFDRLGGIENLEFGNMSA